MSNLGVFSVIPLPAIAAGPSLATLQWSEDGQVFIVTRTAIYILTPNIGIKFNDDSVITSSISKSASGIPDAQPLSWYRTMIELEKTAHNWPSESQEWGAISFGSLDVSWHSVTLSPSNISGECSCVLAALNSNLEVTLWASGKNYLIGEWTKIQDVTQILKELLPLTSDGLMRTFNAQVHCISWSRQVKFTEGSCPVDCSLLALGNRGGNVIFMQLSSVNNDRVLQHVGTVRVCEDWIHHLAWSAWRTLSLDHFQASLACAASDGSVFIISVTVVLEPAANEALPTCQFQFEFQGAVDSCLSSRGGITGMTWIEPERYPPSLAYSKPGIVVLQKFSPRLPLSRTDMHVLTLELQPQSSSSTPYAPASGFLYYEQQDTIISCLSDGSFHAITGVSTSPSLRPSDQCFSSEELSRRVRNVFTVSEGAVTFADANKTSGVCDYDGLGTVMWLHEKCCPEDFSYKQDAKLMSMFVVTRLRNNDALLLDQLTYRLTEGDLFDITSIHALRGVLLHLRDNTFFQTHRDRLFEILKQYHMIDPSLFVTSIQCPSESQRYEGQSLRLNFRRRLALDLFRRQSICSLRLRYFLALYCSSINRDASPPFQSLVEDYSKRLSYNHLQIVLRQLEFVNDQLEDVDREFISRWMALSLAQPLLRDEVTTLAQRMRIGVPADSPPEITEQCPACRAIIPLGYDDTAACPNGHIWARCSITSFLLATPFVRTCIGCCRKALLPSSVKRPMIGDLILLPPTAGSWLVQELLEAVRWCNFCGNKFVHVL